MMMMMMIMIEYFHTETTANENIESNLPSGNCNWRNPATMALLFTRDKSSPRITKDKMAVYVIAIWPLS